MLDRECPLCPHNGQAKIIAYSSDGQYYLGQSDTGEYFVASAAHVLSVFALSDDYWAHIKELVIWSYIDWLEPVGAEYDIVVRQVRGSHVIALILPHG